MKIVKANKLLVVVLNPLLLLIGVLLFFKLPEKMMAISPIFWIGIVCALILIFSPLGKYSLSNKTHAAKQLSWQQWFCAIALLEVTIFLSYFGIAIVSSDLFPINTTAQPDLFKNTLTLFFLHNGLFPWSFYAVIAASMGLIGYRDEKDAYFNVLLHPLFKKETHAMLGSIANAGFRRAVLFSLSILLVFTTLLMSSFLLPLHIVIANGFSGTTILILMGLFALSFSNTAKHYVFQLFSKRIPMRLSLPFFCLLLTVICVALTIIVHGIYPDLSATPPDIITQWLRYPWDTAWMLFSVMWFVCLTPLVCTVIARISYGYQIRKIIMGVLILPLLLSLFLLMQNHITFSFSLSLLTEKILSLIGLCLLLPLLLNHPHLSDAIYAYFPKNGTHKHRDYHRFITELIHILLTSLCFYLTIGINGLAVFLFAPNFLLMIGLILGVIAVAAGRRKKFSEC